MVSPQGAPCTMLLKRQACQHWQNDNKPDWHVLGFTYDEQKRHERFILTETDRVIPVLIARKVTKAMCYDYLRSEGIRIPVMYEYGFPNANCIGCVKSASPTYWNMVRKHFPEVFDDRSEQSRRLGVKLVNHKGKRIYLDELPENAKGHDMKSMPECGLFCEERLEL